MAGHLLPKQQSQRFAAIPELWQVKLPLQALQVAQPSLLDLLAHPGYTGTVLVPTDAAFGAMLAQYPAVLRDPALLQQVLKLHMLPPEPRTK